MCLHVVWKKCYFQADYLLIPREELEEERRLFYVVITRAKNICGSPTPIQDINSSNWYKMNPAGSLMNYLKIT